MAFTAPWHGDSICGRAVRFVNLWANEPQVRAKYDTLTISRMICGGLDQALLDLYNVAQNPPRAAFNVQLVSQQERYMLPANIQQISRVAKIDTVSGRIHWEVIPRSFRDLNGPNIIFEGFTSFRLVPIPQAITDIITIEYIPGGHFQFHQNALISKTGSSTRITSNTTTNTSSGYLMQSATPWMLGYYDRRPNAYLGCSLRLLGTHNDVGGGGVPFFPIQERIITNYEVYGDATAYLKFTTSPSFDIQIVFSSLSDVVNYPGQPENTTWMVYEVLPNCDPGVMLLATVNTAIDLVTIEGNKSKLELLTLAVEKIKRAVTLRWSNAQMINPAHFDDDPYEILDSVLP